MLIPRFISFIMHPLLITTYILVLLLSVHPFAFGVKDITDKNAIIMLLGFVAATVVLPGFGIMLLKPLGFLQNYQKPAREERIGPYIILSILYVWVYKNLSSGIGSPAVFAQIFLGATIALFIAFFLNNWIKVSAHMNGTGGLLAATFLLTTQHYRGAVVTIPVFGNYLTISLSALFLLVVTLVAATAYARLALSAHTTRELWLGLSIGIAGQVLALTWYSL